MGTVEWFDPSRRPSMKESLHVAALPRHIPAQCNSPNRRVAIAFDELTMAI